MEKRGEELLSVGKSGNTFYLLLCFVASILGGFAGIIGGYIYAFSKTSSSRGKSFYVYDEETRKYGRIIFGVAIAFFVCSIMYSLNKHFGM